MKATLRKLGSWFFRREPEIQQNPIASDRHMVETKRKILEKLVTRFRRNRILYARDETTL